MQQQHMAKACPSTQPSTYIQTLQGSCFAVPVNRLTQWSMPPSALSCIHLQQHHKLWQSPAPASVDYTRDVMSEFHTPVCQKWYHTIRLMIFVHVWQVEDAIWQLHMLHQRRKHNLG